MAVLAIKTEPKCKLCNHPERPQIDALLEKRSKGEVDDQGRRFNEAYVLEILATWGVPNPTSDNIKTHWRKHCEVVSAEEAATVDKELDELQQEMLRILDESDGTIDGDLDAIRKLAMKRLRRRVLKGEDPGLTNDHLLKTIGEQTKRSSGEAARTLLGALGAGLAQALTKGPKPAPLPPGEQPVVIEGEVVEE